MSEEHSRRQPQSRSAGDGGAPRPATPAAGNRGGGAKPAFDLRMALLAGAGLLAAALLSVGYFDASPPAPPATHAASLMIPVTAAEVDGAIERLLMGDADKQRVREEVEDGRLRLAWITVSDTITEDGDWIRLEAAGFRQDIRLLHRPYQVAVPYLPGSTVVVTGLVDGIDGDITVAVYVGGSPVSLKPLKQGETLQIPTP